MDSQNSLNDKVDSAQPTEHSLPAQPMIISPTVVPNQAPKSSPDMSGQSTSQETSASLNGLPISPVDSNHMSSQSMVTPLFQKSKQTKTKKIALICGLLTAFLLLIGGIAYMFAQNKQLNKDIAKEKSASTQVKKEESKKLTSNVDGPQLTTLTTTPEPKAKTAHYPDSERIDYMQSCQGGGANKVYCTCTLDYLEQNVPYKELLRMYNQAKQGNSAEMESLIYKAGSACI